MRPFPIAISRDQARRRSRTVARCRHPLNTPIGEPLVARDERGIPVSLVSVVSLRREKLYRIVADRFKPNYGREEMVKEGFPGMDPKDFVVMFCKLNNCRPRTPVTRIEWRYL